MRVSDGVLRWLENTAILLLCVAVMIVAWVTLGQAADLPKKPAVAPPPVLITSPFYFGVVGGAGFSSTESELTLLGTAQGPIKAFPTGAMLGGDFGARWNTGTLVFGLNVTALYDFSRGDVGGIAPNSNVIVAGGGPAGAAACVGTCLGPIASRKNGLLLMEGGEVGINLSTLMGYVPVSAQPTNWPVPINVPASVAGNVNATAIGGVAQRWLTLCGETVIDVAGDMASECASKIINGPYIGGQLSAMLSAQVEAKLKVAHIFWNSSFTPASTAAGVFQNTISAKDENLVLIGLDYHF